MCGTERAVTHHIHRRTAFFWEGGSSSLCRQRRWQGYHAQLCTVCDENHHRKLYPKHREVTPTRSAFAKQQVSTCALHVALCRKSRGTNYCPAKTITSARKGEGILHTFVFGSTVIGQVCIVGLVAGASPSRLTGGTNKVSSARWCSQASSQNLSVN